MDAEIKTAIDGVMTTFEAFKAANDASLAEIKKTGVADPITTDKLGKIETRLAAYEDLNQRLTLAQAAAKGAEEGQKALGDAMAKLEAKMGRPGATGDDPETKKRAAEYRAAFDSYLRKTERGLTAAEHKTLTEFKVLQASNDTLGGYYLTPAEMANEIIKAVVLMSPMRALARVTPIGVASLKLPKRTGTFAAVRVGEIASRTETTGYTTGMVEIQCPEMYAEVHVSEQMIEDSMFDIQGEMQLEFAEQFAVKEGAEFISGLNTANQAEGFLTATGTNSVVTGSAADITADSLFTAFYGSASQTGLKTAYAANATWVMTRATLGSVRKLKDGEGGYLWLPGIANGVPNTIMGAPYAEMPDMPAIGAGLYPIAVGDWRRAYRVVDRITIQVLRDPFTIANSGQILFRARKRVGGAVTLGEAIVKLKCST